MVTFQNCQTSTHILFMNSGTHTYLLWGLIINRVALAKQGDHEIDSVRPSVRLHALSCHYQSKAFVCVSVIRGRMRIIARMRLISF